MTSLKNLELLDCPKLEHFPEIMGKMHDLEVIYVTRTGIKLLPDSIGNLTGLVHLCILDNNNLVSLPESIKQLDRLKYLFVHDCKKLRQISGIPSNLRQTATENCTSLTSQSASVLWSQVIRGEVQGLYVVMTRGVVPDWVNHRCKGGALSFWFRRKFPSFASAVVVSQPTNETSSHGCSFYPHCFIDGHLTDVGFRECLSGPTILQKPLNDIVSNFKSLDWKYVEIKCHPIIVDHLPIHECGVYVYKQDINMEDIQFESPIPDNSNMDHVMSRDDAELRDKIEEAKPRIRSRRTRRENMSRNDETIDDAKPRRMSRIVTSRNDKELETEKSPTRFIKKSSRKRVGIRTSAS